MLQLKVHRTFFHKVVNLLEKLYSPPVKYVLLSLHNRTDIPEWFEFRVTYDNIVLSSNIEIIDFGAYEISKYREIKISFSELVSLSSLLPRYLDPLVKIDLEHNLIDISTNDNISCDVNNFSMIIEILHND